MRDTVILRGNPFIVAGTTNSDVEPQRLIAYGTYAANGIMYTINTLRGDLIRRQCDVEERHPQLAVFLAAPDRNLAAAIDPVRESASAGIGPVPLVDELVPSENVVLPEQYVVDHVAAIRRDQGVIVGRVETLDFVRWEWVGGCGLGCVFGNEAQLSRIGRECGC